MHSFRNKPRHHNALRRRERPRIPGLRALTFSLSVAVLLSGSTMVATADLGIEVKADIRDLYFGEALLHAYQDDYFSAIARFDTELAQHYALDNPEQDTLRFHREESELLIGDLELSYRMHRKVGRAMKRLLRESVHESIRDRAAYRLARIAFQKGAYENVLVTVGNVSKNAPKDLRQKSALLQAQALIALDRSEDAVAVLKPLRDQKAVAGYAPFNLGIALIESGNPVSGIKQLDAVGTMKQPNREMSALSDKANLAVGYALLNAEQPKRARPYLERVRLEGPFSNKALLWVGWTDAAQGRYKKALVPWMMLRERDVTDIAVQEAMLAAPYGFGKIEAYGKAAVLYGEAVETFEREIERLDASIKSIREGKFLDAMLREEAEHQDSWLLRLRELPDAPETRYLSKLMASHVFHESYKNYRDLHFLRENIDQWLAVIPAYHDLLRVRRQYYEPLLPKIDREFNRLDTQLAGLLTRREMAGRRLNTLKRKREPMALATSAERQIQRRLDEIEKKIARLREQPGRSMLKEKHERLKGVLYWQINTQYERRLSLAYKHLKELDQAIATTRQSHRALVRVKAEAALSYKGYERTLGDMQTRLQYLKTKIAGVIAYQGQFMQRIAVGQLTRRLTRIKQYRTKARFALAESYDRATRTPKGKAK